MSRDKLVPHRLIQDLTQCQPYRRDCNQSRTLDIAESTRLPVGDAQVFASIGVFKLVSSNPGI
jgi:hypothetical protein